MDNRKWLAVSVACAFVVLTPQRGVGQDAPYWNDIAVWHEAVGLEAKLGKSSERSADVLRAARLELVLGRPDLAAALLSKYRNRLGPGGELYSIMGEIEYRLGKFDSAAMLFMSAGEASRGHNRGVYFARAGESFEHANAREMANTQYRLAANLLPEIGSWLAIRRARTMTDTVRAFSLLAVVPRAARTLAARARAELRLGASDTAGATLTFVRAGLPLRAAVLALARGDSARARNLTYGALSDPDTAHLREALALTRQVTPHSQGEFVSLARATLRLRGARAALGLAARSVELGPPNAEALLLWGDLLAQTGSGVKALDSYRRAIELGGVFGLAAAFRRGRLQLRLGRVSAGLAALQNFADNHPAHARAAEALYTVAERKARARPQVDGQDLYKAISERWPRSIFASRSRFKLASWAVAAGDTASALRWYQVEISRSGVERHQASYRMAEVFAAGGDTLEALGLWASLARTDSIGYYGTIARRAAGLPPLKVDPIQQAPQSRATPEILAALDVLNETLFEEDAEVLIESIMKHRPRPPSELLDLAEGLIKRGHTAEGIRLGWRAAQAYTLNHPRVLRVIFPWPLRDLIEEEAREFDVDPYLVAGLIRQESSFKSDAISRAGAHGLMQLMPPTGREVARGLSVEWDRRLLLVADANLHFGVAHFAALLRTYKGDVAPALAAYNAGGTPVRRWLRVPGSGNPVRFVEAVTYSETQGYLKTVLRNRALYRALYPSGREEAGSRGLP